MAEYSHFSANFSQISKHWFTKNTPLLFLVIRNVLEHAFFCLIYQFINRQLWLQKNRQWNYLKLTLLIP